MTYQALARKWRPQIFEQLVGQQHVVRALTHALSTQRLHHAYLFSGTRGVGKTTLGRLLAKCLNCETGVTATPCEQCSTCQAIQAGNFVDLVEVDAASRTKVEDTKELLENVQYVPTVGRYKVYLIDEVHMLSNHSFNALLKTLEEPPEYVVFILATTDPNKLPVTVLSRCLVFQLKALSPILISQQLTHVLEQEKIAFEAEALAAIAQAADGSMRDALSLLDQAIAFCAGKVSLAPVSEMLGIVDSQYLLNIAQAVADHDAERVMQVTGEMTALSVDFEQALSDLVRLFHQVALIQQLGKLPEPRADEAQLVRLAELFSPDDCQLMYQICLVAGKDLPYAASLKEGFEMTMLRLLSFYPVLEPEPTRAIKPNVESNSQPTNSNSSIKKTATALSEPQVKAQAAAPAVSGDLSAMAGQWADLLPLFGFSGLTQMLASHCVVGNVSGSRIELVLDAVHAPLANATQESYLAEGIGQYYQQKVSVKIRCQADSGIQEASPAKVMEKKQSEQLEVLKQSSAVQVLQAQFDAKIVNSTLKKTEKLE